MDKDDDDFGSYTQALLGLVLRMQVRSTELPYVRSQGTCVLVKVVPTNGVAKPPTFVIIFLFAKSMKRAPKYPIRNDPCHTAIPDRTRMGSTTGLWNGSERPAASILETVSQRMSYGY